MQEATANGVRNNQLVSLDVNQKQQELFVVF